MPLEFLPASTEGLKICMALTGASGSGKTLTALKIAQGFGGKVCVIDTENGKSRIYANRVDTKPFFVFELTKFKPASYVYCIEQARDAGCDVCVIDSISHEWNGVDGVLDIAGGDIRGWKAATPEHNKFLAAVTRQTTMHMIVTMRGKQKYALEIATKTNRMEVRKLGEAPIQRPDIDYEFDIIGYLDQDHVLTFDGVGKSRFDALTGQTFPKPGAELATAILAALEG